MLLTFQPHDPIQLAKQLRFFERAPSYGFQPRLLRTEAAPKVFDTAEDAADEEGDGAHSGSAVPQEEPHVGQPASVLCRRVYLYALRHET